MNYYKKISILFISVFVSGFLLLSAPIIYATATPTLSLTSTGSGDNVQINVTGDPGASVILFYTSTGAGSGLASLGSTNSSGNFSAIVSSATYGIASNSAVYVRTSGINGPMSNQVAWPYFSSTTTSSITLSPSSLLLNIGQTSTITASVSSLYMSSNSTPAVANINLNGATITVQALAYGTTTATICAVGSTTNCATLPITVQNSTASQLTFNQNNFSVVSGQSIPVTITGGSGTYTISNNSNPSAIQTSLNGSTITLTATSTSGAASITVCTTDMNNCGIINVSSTTVNSTAITFSQTNPVVPIGQTTTVTIYGGTGTNFYVSSNSNPSIVQANITSNILTLIGNATSGTSNINICAYAGSCGSLTVNVTSASTNGSLSLSQNTISILAGQSSNITILGGSTPYNVSSSSTNIFNGVINGNIVTIYGVNPGTATANICASVGCATLSVTINSVTSSTNPPTFSQNNILLNVGQQITVYVSGTGSFYLGSSNTSNISSAVISGSSVVVTGITPGSTNFSICQSGGQCSTLYTSVNSSSQSATLTASSLTQSVATGSVASFTVTASGFTNPSYSLSDSFPGTTTSNADINSLGYFNWTPAASDVGSHNITIYATDSSGHSANTTTQIIVTQATAQTPQTSYYNFSKYLKYGDTGEDVLMLQQILQQQGFLSTTPNGHYGLATMAAVKSFQKAHGLNPLGVVGPSTRTLLDQISTSGTTATTKQQQILQIQQAIQQLLAQVAQIQGH
ncbi:MAG: peptidoglycan-binding domain-containing protein [Candidatus Staskawiczbacteria bacterium]|jgi:hypothetical protein